MPILQFNAERRSNISEKRGAVTRMLVVMKATACAPQTAVEILPTHASYPRVAAALTYIHQHLDERLKLEQLAKLCRLSVSRFVTLFRQALGMPPHRYISGARLERARTMLKRGCSPADTAQACGFYDQSHLALCLKNACGLTPRQLQSPSGASLPASAPIH
ncbi:helix-turn-helix transcriptional regulator (plasmid) [Cupriavidus sp. P-10]|uniref:helix-turn-helix domain-containing protein n=1 Tax=Cupriavidus sp. P-10 TaxID=2027911 RepID=UPI001F25E3EA|nr:AraC family transcriptional regulator [Cupriavidus sp. P-10]BDB29789.1 helix-turn-helix transcriptional regulator [Cupriavidus sp. P-10]